MLLYVVYTEVFYTRPSETGYYCCSYYNGNYGRRHQYCRDNVSPYTASECKDYCDQDRNCTAYDTYTSSGSSNGRCWFYTTSSSCPTGFGLYNEGQFPHIYAHAAYSGCNTGQYSGCFKK